MKNKPNVTIPEEEVLEDTVESFVNSSNEEHDKEHIDDQGKIKKATSNLKMQPKHMLIELAGAAILILFILFGDNIKSIPFLNSDKEDNELSQDKEPDQSGEEGLTGMLNAFDKTEKTNEQEGEQDSEGMNNEQDYLSAILTDLREYYPGYEITPDDETKTINILGNHEGKTHKIVMDYEAKVISDEFLAEGANQDTQAQNEEGDSSKGNDKVEVTKEQFQKSLLSKPTQTLQVVEVDETNTFTSSVKTYREKLIVEYERLPLQGGFTMLYAKVIETGEELIFPVTLQQYGSLPEKGTSVLEVNRAEGYGVKTINSVSLVNWQN